MEDIMFFLLAICLIIIVFFWVLFYKAFAKLSINSIPISDKLPEVSIILCYKNAKDHVSKTIQSILNQQYPSFEVIAIDDFSTDGSFSTLEPISDSRLVLLKAAKDAPGKKTALTQAINCAKNEFLLFTDADCIPAGDGWIKSMVTTMVHSKDTEIVLGYGPMQKKKGWLNAFVRFETIITALQYMSYAVLSIPYMGVGRNLFYKKSLYLRHNGFESHKNITSGDDDLMISKVATDVNTLVNIRPESFVYSEGKDSVSSFLHQKSRHVTTSVHYKNVHKVLLGMFALSQFGFYVFLFMLMSYGYISILCFSIVLIMKWLLQMILHHRSFTMLMGKDIYLWFPVLDIVMMIYYMTLPLYSLFRKKEW
jgi:poly-beta-1,6-N-acetyl-D-glucosamine synthase